MSITEIPNQVGNILKKDAVALAAEHGYTRLVLAKYFSDGDAYNKGVSEIYGDPKHEARKASFKSDGNRPKPIHGVPSVDGRFFKVYKNERWASYQSSSFFFERGITVKPVEVKPVRGFFFQVKRGDFFPFWLTRKQAIDYVGLKDPSGSLKSFRMNLPGFGVADKVEWVFLEVDDTQDFPQFGSKMLNPNKPLPPKGISPDNIYHKTLTANEQTLAPAIALKAFNKKTKPKIKSVHGFKLGDFFEVDDVVYKATYFPTRSMVCGISAKESRQGKPRRCKVPIRRVAHLTQVVGEEIQNESKNY